MLSDRCIVNVSPSLVPSGVVKDKPHFNCSPFAAFRVPGVSVFCVRILTLGLIILLLISFDASAVCASGSISSEIPRASFPSSVNGAPASVTSSAGFSSTTSAASFFASISSAAAGVSVSATSAAASSFVLAFSTSSDFSSATPSAGVSVSATSATGASTAFVSFVSLDCDSASPPLISATVSIEVGSLAPSTACAFTTVGDIKTK